MLDLIVFVASLLQSASDRVIFSVYYFFLFLVFFALFLAFDSIQSFVTKLIHLYHVMCCFFSCCFFPPWPSKSVVVGFWFQCCADFCCVAN